MMTAMVTARNLRNVLPNGMNIVNKRRYTDARYKETDDRLMVLLILVDRKRDRGFAEEKILRWITIHYAALRLLKAMTTTPRTATARSSWTSSTSSSDNQPALG